MGYGTRALELLVAYFEGKFSNLDETVDDSVPRTMHRVTEAELANVSLQDDEVKVRDMKEMPPLFSKLAERPSERLDYLGVSYGLTQQLHKFWKRGQFVPVYLRQTANDLTGEHTCIMLRPLDVDNQSWLGAYANDFHRRFLSLLSYKFRELPSILALSIEESASSGSLLDPDNEPKPLSKNDMDRLLPPFDLTPYDHKRLESYSNGLLDYHVILDRMPVIANLYFTGRLKTSVKLPSLQQAILLSIGLQRKDIEIVSGELTLQSSQLLAIFVKILKKMTTHFGSLVSGAIDAEMPAEMGPSRANATGLHDDEVVDDKFEPLQISLQDELDEAGDDTLRELRQKQRELIDALPLDQ
jgi:N-acetyltransferase 10